MKIKCNNKTQTKTSKQEIVTFREYIKVGKGIFEGAIINVL